MIIYHPRNIVTSPKFKNISAPEWLCHNKYDAVKQAEVTRSSTTKQRITSNQQVIRYLLLLHHASLALNPERARPTSQVPKVLWARGTSLRGLYKE